MFYWIVLPLLELDCSKHCRNEAVAVSTRLQVCVYCRIQTWVLRHCVDVTQRACSSAHTCHILSVWTTTYSALVSNFIIWRLSAVLCCVISTLHAHILDWLRICWAHCISPSTVCYVNLIIIVTFENCFRLLCGLRYSSVLLRHLMALSLSHSDFLMCQTLVRHEEFSSFAGLRLWLQFQDLKFWTPSPSSNSTSGSVMW